MDPDCLQNLSPQTSRPFEQRMGYPSPARSESCSWNSYPTVPVSSSLFPPAYPQQPTMPVMGGRPPLYHSHTWSGKVPMLNDQAMLIRPADVSWGFSAAENATAMASTECWSQPNSIATVPPPFPTQSSPTMSHWSCASEPTAFISPLEGQQDVQQFALIHGSFVNFTTPRESPTTTVKPEPFSPGQHYTSPNMPADPMFRKASSVDESILLGSLDKRKRSFTTKENASCSCPKCGKLFSRSYNLKAHMDTHNPNRKHPFKCEWGGCDKCFARRTDLVRHEQSVSVEGPAAA